MRFASLQSSNTGDYAAAGKQAADSLNKSFKIARESGPNYQKLAETAMVTQAEQNIASMQASAKVTNSAVNAYADVTRQSYRAKLVKNAVDQKVKNRKAGAIAGLGRIAAAGFLASRDNTKGRERPKDTSREIYESWRTQHQGIKDRQDQERAELGDGPGYTPYNSSGSNGGNQSAGKVDSGSGSNTASQVDGQTGWGRLARVIKTGEGTVGDAGYTTMFTGARFSDTSRHPRQINRSGRLASDAAGAYQFLSTTWDGAKNALGLTDFSPQSQEKAGRYLAQQRGINPDAVYNTKAELGQALDKIAPEWASMPTLATGTSYYGQGGLSLDEAWRIYQGG